MIEIGRRGLIGGALALLAAPNIVRASSLMHVRPLPIQRFLGFGLAPLKTEGGVVEFDRDAYRIPRSVVEFIGGGDFAQGVERLNNMCDSINSGPTRRL